MTEWQGKNLLCYGDNLTFLTDTSLFPDECIDLIYLDPLFNSQQSYNVLFKEASGTPAAAQIKAFEDTWTWDQAANKALTEIHSDPAVPAPLAELMKTEAAAAGTYDSPWDNQAYPKVQILTIEELLADPHKPNPRCLQIPGGAAQHTLPEAPKHKGRKTKQTKLWEKE